MFQYSTETIINSNNGNLLVGGNNVRFAAVTMTKNGLDAAAQVDGAYPDDVAFIVDGVGLYHKKNISGVTVRRYQPAVNEQIAVTIPASLTGVYRLAIYTSQEGISSSIYADAQLRHKKPFFYEVENPTAEKLAALIEKDMRLTDFNFFKAAGTGTTLTLTADDCYTRFQKIHFAKIELEEGNTTGWEAYTDELVVWERFSTTNEGATFVAKGTEGNGTVARLIKNIKLPTDANTNPYASDNGGRPVPGGMYDQVVIEYVTDRRHIGGQVMGALDKSITTHIFWVPAKFDADGDAVNSDFVTELLKVADSDKVNTAVEKIDDEEFQLVAPKTGAKQ